ncbi:MAG TPA: hypothetical protein VFQ53_31080 [Kofleriaceae bacterium]|nr:hypothetical protein [Kofleriaceae bacterium]
MRVKYVIPDETMWFGRFVWGIFAVLAVAMALGAIKAPFDGEPGIAKVLAVLAPISGLIAWLVWRAIPRPDHFVIDIAAGHLELNQGRGPQFPRRDRDVTVRDLAALRELSIVEVTIDRDGPETWYELRAEAVPARLHFTRSRWAAERRMRQLQEHVQHHAVRTILRRPAIDDLPTREPPDDLALLRDAGPLESVLAKLERDDDPDIARRASALHEQLRARN